MSVMESGIGGLIVLNLILSFTIANISVGAHIGGLIGGALRRSRFAAPAIVECRRWAVRCASLAERRRRIGAVVVPPRSRPRPASPTCSDAALSSREVDDTARCSHVPSGEWRRHERDSIVRELKFADFAAAIAFVNRVAELAERANHHPDILVHGWKGCA